MDDLIYKILDSREKRYLKQEDIISKYPFSLISFTLNIPGAIKDSCLFRKVHNEGIIAITEKQSSLSTSAICSSEANRVNTEIKYKEIRHPDTGPEAFFSIDLDPLILKSIMVEIEEVHDLGRLFDIDVFDKNHRQITRSNINKKPRKCLLCDDLAINCIKNKKHTYKELKVVVERMCSSKFNT